MSYFLSFIAVLQGDGRREYNGRRKSIGEFAGVDASVSLALSDEMGGALAGNDLEVVRTTGMEEVDGRRGPLAEADSPLDMSHGWV